MPFFGIFKFLELDPIAFFVRKPTWKTLLVSLLSTKTSRKFWTEFLGKTNENENRSKISISAENKEEADKLFNGLSAGGQIEMPIDNSPWGSYFGMFRDKYGIEWMIDFDPNFKV